MRDRFGGQIGGHREDLARPRGRPRACSPRSGTRFSRGSARLAPEQGDPWFLTIRRVPGVVNGSTEPFVGVRSNQAWCVRTTRPVRRRRPRPRPAEGHDETYPPGGGATRAVDGHRRSGTPRVTPTDPATRLARAMQGSDRLMPWKSAVGWRPTLTKLMMQSSQPANTAISNPVFMCCSCGSPGCTIRPTRTRRWSARSPPARSERTSSASSKSRLRRRRQQHNRGHDRHEEADHLATPLTLLRLENASGALTAAPGSSRHPRG